MISEHNHIGALDLDSPEQVIDPRYFRTARNIVWKGEQGRMRCESVPGTTQIPNPYLPNSGTNKSIGTFYDPVNQQLYDFNYNSAGTHGIYIFNTLAKTWLTLIQTGTNTVGDPLGFTASGRIQGVEMIYGDYTAGNLLLYVDSLKRPTKINVTRFLGLSSHLPPYTNIVRAYLNVIKAPPVAPPRVVYENDTTVNANNLINSLFQFSYSFIYDDNEESVISSASKVPLPVNQFSNTQNIPVSYDSRIGIYVQTGDQNVAKIRLYGRQTQNGVQGSWFIIDTILKSPNGIANNTIYKYLFFNNGNYVQADPKFTVLLYDWTPPYANCQALLDGNVISYAGITEGYPYFKSNFSEILGGNSNSVGASSVVGHLFFADYNGLSTGGQPQVEIYLSGAGTNDGSGNPVNLTYAAQNYYVNAVSSGSDVSFSVLVNSSLNIPTILTAIKSAAISAGWTFVSQGTNNLIIYYPSGTVSLKSTRILGATPLVTTFYKNAMYPQSSYSWGVQYYDANGVTNGVITDITANIDTLPYNYLGSVTYTQVLLNLNGITPPAWASYYHIVRTNTLTYNKSLYWVSSQAFSNAGALVLNQYAYIGISNISDYNLQIQATQGVVGYEFAPGDRIKFLRVYKLNGTSVQLNNDYEILGVEVNPIVNGTAQTGSFIKIAYPAADINPVSFRFDGNADYQAYEVLVYSIAQNTQPQTENTGTTSADGNVYYEIGEQYGIGNAGLNTAYHYGNIADNQVAIQDGDIFYRTRTVPAGNTYYQNVSSFYFGNRYATPLIQLPGSIVTTAYTVGAQNNLSADPNNYSNYPRFSDGGGLFLNTGNAQQIRLRGTVQVTADHPTWMDIYAKIDNPDGVTGTTVTLLAKSDPISTLSSTSIDITFDATFGVPAGAKMWLIFGNGDTAVNLHCSAFQLRIDVIRNIPIQIFEPSFSDVYNLVTNSDSRPNTQNTEAQTTYFSTLFRYSQPYELGTNINNTNRFYPNDFDEFDKSYGDVMRITVYLREGYIWQKRRCGHFGIYAKFIKDNSGANVLVTTDSIITPNNVEYFEGEYGIGNQPDSIGISGFQHYFVDPVKGYFCRLSKDGIVPLSELYHVQTYAGAKIPPYLNNYNYQFGGNSVILGCYNFAVDRAAEVIFVMQGGTSVNGNITGESFAFKEEGNAWTSFYDFVPDSLVCCENTLYSFYNGVLYSHNNKTTYCNFYGTQYVPTVTVVKNDNPGMKKTWVGIIQVANVQWNSPLIYTNASSYAGQRQESNLVDNDFTLKEGEYSASFLKDIHSIGGIVNGQWLKGTTAVIQLQPTNGAVFNYLSSIRVKYNVSPVLQK